MPYFIQATAYGTCGAAVVAPSTDWCVTNLGGEWVEMPDPYNPDPDDPRRYAGPGYKYDPGVVEQFVIDEWTVDKSTQQQLDDEGQLYWFYNTQGQLTWHNGRAWRNLLPTGTPNVWEPGVANWREYPFGANYPLWLQPTGATDAYPLGFRVEHNGSVWESLTPANVWEPGAVGSESLWLDVTGA